MFVADLRTSLRRLNLVSITISMSELMAPSAHKDIDKGSVCACRRAAPWLRKTIAAKICAAKQLASKAFPAKSMSRLLECLHNCCLSVSLGHTIDCNIKHSQPVSTLQMEVM